MAALLLALRILVISDAELSGEAAAVRDGLVQALRIQLAGSAEIRAVSSAGGDLPARTAEAARLVAQHDALLAVWIRAAGDRLVLHAVGRDRGRAIVEVFSTPPGDTGQVSRALALKVSDVVDSLRGDAGAGTWLAIAGRARGARDARRPARPRRHAVQPRGWQVLLGAHAHAPGGDAGWQPGLGLGLSRTAELAGGRAAAALELAMRRDLAARNTAGRVDIDEAGAAIGASWWRGDDWAFGGGAGLEARWIEATGVTPRGAIGEGSALVPGVVGLLGVERRLGPVAVRAQAGARVALVRRRFAVNDEVVLDLGRLQPRAVLAVVIPVAW